MANPTKKCTKKSKRQRASHFALKAKSLLNCMKCSQPVLPHRACRACGAYKTSSVFAKAYTTTTSK